MTLILLSLGIFLQICAFSYATKKGHDFHVAPPGINTNAGASGLVSVNPQVSVDFPGASSPVIPIFVQPVKGRPIVTRLECGSTVQMYAGSTAQIQSTNFGLSNYNNHELCTWKFEANHCTLSADCPCVEIPKSWECLGDYLRISTDFIQSQRFCGGNVPGQPIYSDSDALNIKFRTDSRITAAGFTCFIRCEGPGMKIPPMKDSIKCPSSLISRG